MPHVLHLLGEPNDRVARETIARQARDPDTRLSVVLIRDASALAEPLPGPPLEVYRLEDGTRHADSPHPAITHDRLLELIFEADTVVTW